MKLNSFITNELARADSAFNDTPLLNSLARASGWIRRASRNFSPADLLRSLIAECCGGSGTFKALSAAGGARTSSQNIHKRINADATNFLASVLGTALSDDERMNCSIFNRVVIEDCSHFQAPERLVEQLPSYGNQHGKTAGVKLHFAYDLLSGSPVCVDLIKARVTDQSLAEKLVANELRAGDLLIRDKGFFSVNALVEIQFLKAFYLSRLPRSLKPMDEDGSPLDLVARLMKASGNMVECVATLGHQTGLPTRLIAVRVPKQKAKQREIDCRKRIRQSRGKLPAKHLVHCHWELVVTNVPFPMMKAEDLAALYRCRWRIELAFKALKSGHFSSAMATHSTNKHHWLALLLARLIAFLPVLRLGQPDTTVGSMPPPPSLHKCAKLWFVALGLKILAPVFGEPGALDRIMRRCCLFDRRKRDNHYDFLANCLS